MSMKDFLYKVKQPCDKCLYKLDLVRTESIPVHSVRSVSDKYETWRELISDYPDMPVPPLPEYGISSCFESLHTMILTQIDCEERILQNFMEQTPGAVYQHQAIWDCKWRYSDSVYTSFEKAWANVMDSCGRHEVSEILVEKIFPDGGAA